jgi:hypothetical protein
MSALYECCSPMPHLKVPIKIVNGITISLQFLVEVRELILIILNT